MKTANPHFDEIDWLDYEEGLLDPREAAEMESHLTGCPSCRSRSRSLRRLAAALSPMRELVDGAELEPNAGDRDLVAHASALAAETVADFVHARAELEASGADLPDPESFPALKLAHVHGAVALARESFGRDLERSHRLLDWASRALGVLSEESGMTELCRGLKGSVRASAAYLTLRDGRAREALSELEEAESQFRASMPLADLEIAFCAHLRANCLKELSRFDEALREIAVAERIYAQYGDRRRRAKAQFGRAILLSDSGQSEQALSIYEQLLQDPGAIADPPVYALIHLSLAYDLVLTGALDRAKTLYARAAALLKNTGQADQLFRIRVGLADIAYREGRIEEALALNLQLRAELRRRRLTWDEVRRELWIVREMLELGRFEEARSACFALVERAGELGLKEEAQRALSFLASAETRLDLEDVYRIQEELQLMARGAPTRWSVA